jgi:hypothetical protein
VILLPILTGCAHTLYTVSNTQSTATPDVALECVQAKTKELGYERVRYDATERWYVVRRLDYSVHISSGTFRRAFDLLDIRIHPDASGTTALEIKAQTFHQYELQRGQTDEEQSASTRVKADAATVAQACSQ